MTKTTKMVATMTKKHGSYDAFCGHMRRLGSIGGKRSGTGGFACQAVGKDGLTGRQRARVAGLVGGRKSKKGAGEL